MSCWYLVTRLFHPNIGWFRPLNRWVITNPTIPITIVKLRSLPWTSSKLVPGQREVSVRTPDASDSKFGNRFGYFVACGTGGFQWKDYTFRKLTWHVKNNPLWVKMHFLMNSNMGDFPASHVSFRGSKVQAKCNVLLIWQNCWSIITLGTSSPRIWKTCLNLNTF